MRATTPLRQLLGRGRIAPRLRIAWGASLFPGAIQFVTLVAYAMTRWPALFASFPLQGPDLQARQEEATDLLFLCQTLQEMHDLVHDAYLERQSSAIRDALAVLLRHRREAPAGLSRAMYSRAEQSLHNRRHEVLGAAQEVLDDRYARRRSRPRTP